MKRRDFFKAVVAVPLGVGLVASADEKQDSVAYNDEIYMVVGDGQKIPLEMARYETKLKRESDTSFSGIELIGYEWKLETPWLDASIFQFEGKLPDRFRVISIVRGDAVYELQDAMFDRTGATYSPHLKSDLEDFRVHYTFHGFCKDMVIREQI